MFRSIRSAVILATILAALSVTGWAAGSAQEATPGPATPVAQRLGSAEPSTAPGKVLVLSRVTFPPGSTIPLHTHPGVTLLVVESGSFGITVMSGTATINRAPVNGTAGPTEPLMPNVESILNTGDAFFEDEGAMHIARNASDGETVVIVTQLLEAGQPGLILATPAP